VANLQKLLELFFGYQRPEIANFRRAVDQFKLDLPAVLKALRDSYQRCLFVEQNLRGASGRISIAG
jgi:hypothetical protein